MTADKPDSQPSSQSSTADPSQPAPRHTASKNTNGSAPASVDLPKVTPKEKPKPATAKPLVTKEQIKATAQKDLIEQAMKTEAKATGTVPHKWDSSQNNTPQSSQPKNHSPSHPQKAGQTEQTEATLTNEEKLARLQEKTERQLKARQRQQNYIEMRRGQKRRRVIYSRLRILARVLFFIGCGAATWWLWTAEFWDFKPSNPDTSSRISFQSPDHFTFLNADKFKPWIEAEGDQRLYFIDINHVENQIKAAYPIIEDIQLRRQLFPSRITGQWTEFKPWALLVSSPEQKLPDRILSSHYQPIPIKDYQSPFNDSTEVALPQIIRGSGQSNAPLTPEQWMRIDELTQQLQAITPLKLNRLDIRQLNDIRVDYKQVTVRLGRFDDNISQRLKSLVPLIPEILKREKDTSLKPIKWVDLRWEKQVTLKLDTIEPVRTEQKDADNE